MQSKYVIEAKDLEMLAERERGFMEIDCFIHVIF